MVYLYTAYIEVTRNQEGKGQSKRKSSVRFLYANKILSSSFFFSKFLSFFFEAERRKKKESREEKPATTTRKK